MDDKKERTAFGAGTPQTEENIENSTANNIAENSGKIKVVFQRPGELSKVLCIPNTLEAFQQLVGGYIETLTLPSGFVIVMNEEGRLKGLRANIISYAGVIVGNVVITKAEGEDFVSLTPEQIQAARGWLLRHTYEEEKTV